MKIFKFSTAKKYIQCPLKTHPSNLFQFTIYLFLEPLIPGQGTHSYGYLWISSALYIFNTDIHSFPGNIHKRTMDIIFLSISMEFHKIGPSFISVAGYDPVTYIYDD